MIHEHWQRYLARDLAHAPAGESRAGIAWVPELAAVRFRGSNAREFLQGYLTSDMHDLTVGALQPTALCNLKGRVVANGWCAPEGEQDVLMVLHASLIDALARFLKPYLMFSRQTTMEDLRDQALLLASLDTTDEDGLVLDSRRRIHVFEDVDRAVALWERHPPLDGERWLAALTADGVPLISAAVSEQFLPQMLGLDDAGAIDFEKGCYLGQEVVARAQHRGQVKRRLRRLTWRGTVPPAAGSEVTADDGRPQGVVVQSAREAGDEGGWLLAVLREGAPQRLRQGDTGLRRPG